MKFKINRDTKTYKNLVELHERGRECTMSAEKWIFGRFGRKLPFASPEGVLWGGIAAIRFNSAKKGWKQINGQYKLYAPESSSIDIKSIELLPIVLKRELKDILEYGEYPCPGGINTIPSVMLSEDVALICVPDEVRGYEPVEDMREILGSEYNFLYDIAEKEREV